MSTAWAMPSRWTFSIPPIAEFLDRHLAGCSVIVDPFAGQSTRATHSNDLARGGVDAVEFCEALLQQDIEADAILFDPPYSPRQIAECYRGIGLKPTQADTQSGFYSRARRPLSALLRPGGVALSFGWQSGGFSKTAYTTEEILLVQHGGAHNDTICVAQRKNVGT